MHRGHGLPNPAHALERHTQAVRIFRNQWDLMGAKGTVFQRLHRGSGHISNNPVTMALTRIGVDGRICGHGCRSLAIESVQERLGIDRRIADLQPVHLENNTAMAAYNRAACWPAPLGASVVSRSGPCLAWPPLALLFTLNRPQGAMLSAWETPHGAHNSARESCRRHHDDGVELCIRI